MLNGGRFISGTRVDIYVVLDDIVVTFPSFEEDFKFCNPHSLTTLKYVEYANYRTGSQKR